MLPELVQRPATSGKMLPELVQRPATSGKMLPELVQRPATSGKRLPELVQRPATSEKRLPAPGQPESKKRFPPPVLRQTPPRGRPRREGASRAAPARPHSRRGALWQEPSARDEERSGACLRRQSSPAGRAKGLVARVEEELLTGAVCGGHPTIGEVARREPLGDDNGLIAIAERGSATHAQSEHHNHYHHDTYDQDKEHRYLRLRNRDGRRYTSCGARADPG
jgi:hypothetical protein